MPYKKILAKNLICFRESEGLSQEEISFRSGISKETISLIERERTNVTLEVLERLAAYTGLTVPELLTDNFVKKEIMLVNGDGK